MKSVDLYDKLFISHVLSVLNDECLRTLDTLLAYKGPEALKLVEEK